MSTDPAPAASAATAATGALASFVANCPVAVQVAICIIAGVLVIFLLAVTACLVMKYTSKYLSARAGDRFIDAPTELIKRTGGRFINAITALIARGGDRFVDALTSLDTLRSLIARAGDRFVDALTSLIGPAQTIARPTLPRVWRFLLHERLLTVSGNPSGRSTADPGCGARTDQRGKLSICVAR